ncbi:aryl-sulfate sulfotransferase [Pediococcus siamensis]|uniref:aryl-sulfate sulfotransferase n=1 Tax=Pediococcus siamensis TaxID=381829 RepID=UPI00399F3ABB
MKHIWQKIIIGLLFFFLVIGGIAYHERHNIRRFFLVNQVHRSAHILTTAQIKLNLKPALSTKNTTTTNQLSATYRRKLANLSVGITHAKVIVNPYKTSPLTGLILVKTSQATQVTMRVLGDSPQTTITKKIPGYTKQHQVGILGLYANRTNHVQLTFTTKSGTKITKTYFLRTGKASARIGTNTVKTSHPTQMALGTGNTKLTFAVSSQGITYGLDAQGKVRWYSTNYISHVFKQLANGHLLILTKINPNDHHYNALQETDYYGRVYRQYNFNGLFPSKTNHKKLVTNTVIHHDAIELPDHNLLLTVSDGGADYVEDTMIELDRQTGKIKKVIDLKRILPKSAYTKYHGTTRSDGKLDWFHQNSMYYDKRTGTLIVSGRNQDMIFAINCKTTKLKWILAANQKLPTRYQKYLLKPTTKHYKFNAGQHAVMLLQPDKAKKNQLQLQYYDNNVVVTRGNQSVSKKYSAGTIVSINQLKKTVTKTWSYGKSRGTYDFTNIVGSSYAVGKGNTLINFGYADSGKRSEFVEVNRKTKYVVFDVNRTNFPSWDWTYRAQRMSLFPKHTHFSLKNINQ